MPFLTLYSTFSQRVVDYIIHDVRLQNLPVIMCLDRAGIVGDDGPTHHGVFDIPLFRAVPNLVIAQPRDEAELFVLLHSPLVRGYWSTAIRAAAVRARFCPNIRPAWSPARRKSWRPRRPVQIWALGDMTPMAREAAAQLATGGVAAGVVNARFHPLAAELLAQHCRDTRVIVTWKRFSWPAGLAARWAAAGGPCLCRLLRFSAGSGDRPRR